MRPSRLLVLLLVCLSAAGCMRRGPKYYMPPQPGLLYAQPIAMPQTVYVQPQMQPQVMMAPPAPASTQSVPVQPPPPPPPPSVVQPGPIVVAPANPSYVP